MGYLIFQILVFLLIAALLGFAVGWWLRNARSQGEYRDIDARWRSKLNEVEGERDRFAGEVNQANEAITKYETSAAEARRLAETHEASLHQLQTEHQAKLGLLSDVEQRAGSLESDLAGRDRELAEVKASLARQQEAGSEAERLGRELAAASGRAETLERDLQTAKEANSDCKREVERLQARIAELQRSAASAGSDTSADAGDTGSGSTGDASGSPAAGGVSGGGALGLVGGTDTTSAGASGDAGSASGSSGSGFRQPETSPSHLAEAGGQGFARSEGEASSTGEGAEEENEGVRPEALDAARGGVADDLKKISGVGPKLEQTLNGLGIFHFSQIADFTPDNIAWVDRHLRFKGRIERENWIEQAKILAAGGETDFSRRS